MCVPNPRRKCRKTSTYGRKAPRRSPLIRGERHVYPGSHRLSGNADSGPSRSDVLGVRCPQVKQSTMSPGLRLAAQPSSCIGWGDGGGSSQENKGRNPYACINPGRSRECHTGKVGRRAGWAARWLRFCRCPCSPSANNEPAEPTHHVVRITSL